MQVQTFTVGIFLTNCYVATCKQTRETMIIDPGFNGRGEAERIVNFMKKNALEPRFIVDTHGHPDHTCGNGKIKEAFGTPIYIHENDAHFIGEMGREIASFFGFNEYSPQADFLLKDGDVLKLGKEKLTIIHTPGHSSGSMSLLGESEVFSGDTLFAGSIGRTDFPESSEKDMHESLMKLAKLPDHLVVYPGHGLTTTIGIEKANNPFLTELL